MKQNIRNLKFAQHVAAFLSITAILCSGCASHDDETTADIKWIDLINDLTKPEKVARLDTLDSKLISSSDPTRNNKDHNHFVRMEKIDGRNWIVVADIKGSGYVSRYWCTGTNNREHPIRFYFNNERKPRIDTHYRAFFGGKEPYLPPLANREQGCWYSYMPIPFSERLVIMIDATDQTNGQVVKDYHHINYSLVTNGLSVQTFPKKITEEHIKAINEANVFWKDLPETPSTASTQEVEKEETINPASSISLALPEGPTIITHLEIEPDFKSIPSAIDREKLLRDLVLQISWNGEDKPSVNVPVGDFFGSFVRRTRFKTLYVGMKDSTFFSTFPMPYEKSAKLVIKNDGKFKVPIALKWHYRKLDTWKNDLGYFHSAWSKSGPEHRGKPHVMLRAEGRGKYVGCFLSVTSMDRSWWALESNDYIYTDDDISPSWQGTGLEDYFNGGWYYKNAKVRPAAGLLFHTPFKTVQYRLHMTDPVHFKKKIYFEFERGPNQVSRAHMESSVYYYLSAPAPAPEITIASEKRYEARLELEQHTLMREINNQDNIGDLQGASDHIDEYLERFPNYEHKEMLKLRQLAYQEALHGFDSVKDEYISIINTSSNKYVTSEAKKLLWFHEDPSHALLIMYCNAETFPFIDGKPYGRYDHPEMAFSTPVVLSPGKHVFCIKTRKTRQMAWALAHLRTHKGNVIQPRAKWKYTFTPPPGIHKPGVDDSSWTLTQGQMKGPPEIPFIRLDPNPYVNMLPHSTIVLPGDKNGPDGYTYYRKEFEF